MVGIKIQKNHSIDMRKVLLIANSSFTIFNFRSELISRLKELNCEIHVACPQIPSDKYEKEIKDYLKEMKIQCHELKIDRSALNPILNLFLILKITNIMKKIKPHIVLSYTIKANIYALLASAFFNKIKVFPNITGLGYVFINNDLFTKFIRLFVNLQYRIAFKFSQKVFFQNYDDMNIFKLNGLLNGVETKKINGSGVNLDRFSSSRTKKDNLSFIFVGRLLKDKGIYEYINAAKIIKKKYPSAKFRVLGDLDNNPSSLSPNQLNDLIDEKVIEYITDGDVVKWLDRSEVFVLPSYREGTPKSTLEALSMGLPIITTDVPGCRETVRDGINGFLVKDKDVTTLKVAMDKFIQNKELIAEMGLKSRELAESKFDVNKVVEVIIDELDIKNIK